MRAVEPMNALGIVSTTVERPQSFSAMLNAENQTVPSRRLVRTSTSTAPSSLSYSPNPPNSDTNP